MVSSRSLMKVTNEQWEEIKRHALKNNPFPFIFEECPYITVYIAEDCLFTIVPIRQHNFLMLDLCVIPKPGKELPKINRDLWDKMEAEAWKMIRKEPRDINH